jgi:hypothetical protein
MAVNVKKDNKVDCAVVAMAAYPPWVMLTVETQNEERRKVNAHGFSPCVGTVDTFHSSFELRLRQLAKAKRRIAGAVSVLGTCFGLGQEKGQRQEHPIRLLTLLNDNVRETWLTARIRR